MSCYGLRSCAGCQVQHAFKDHKENRRQTAYFTCLMRTKIISKEPQAIQPSLKFMSLLCENCFIVKLVFYSNEQASFKLFDVMNIYRSQPNLGQTPTWQIPIREAHSSTDVTRECLFTSETGSYFYWCGALKDFELCVFVLSCKKNGESVKALMTVWKMLYFKLCALFKTG